MKKTGIITLYVLIFLAMTAISVMANDPEITVMKSNNPPTIDGETNDEVWSEASLVNSKLVIDNSYDKSKITSQKSVAYLAHDSKNLYVAVVSYVEDTSAINTSDNDWGSVEGVEVCFSPDYDGNDIIYSIQSFPSGDHIIKTPAATTDIEGKSVNTAASVGSNYWEIEYSISLADFDLEIGNKIDFNIGAYDSTNSFWKNWIGTGSSTWKVYDAGDMILEK